MRIVKYDSVQCAEQDVTDATISFGSDAMALMECLCENNGPLGYEGPPVLFERGNVFGDRRESYGIAETREWLCRTVLPSINAIWDEVFNDGSIWEDFTLSDDGPAVTPTPCYDYGFVPFIVGIMIQHDIVEYDNIWYEARVQMAQAEGMTRGDAQGFIDAEARKRRQIVIDSINERAEYHFCITPADGGYDIDDFIDEFYLGDADDAVRSWGDKHGLIYCPREDQ